MDKKTKGAWLVHHTSKLGGVESTDDFGNIQLAGKCGQLLSALTASDQLVVPTAKLQALARAARINLKFELPILLERLKKSHLIETTEAGVDVIGLTTPAVLQHTADIFDSSESTASEGAALELAELCSVAPQHGNQLREYLGDRHKLPRQQIESLLKASEIIGFTDVQRVDTVTSLYFNGNLFRVDDPKKFTSILDSLTPTEARLVAEVDELLKSSGCLLSTDVEVRLGVSLFRRLQSIGVYDVSVVSNSKEAISYVTRPSAFSKFGGGEVADSFDLAKALVASITYGMHRSEFGRGRIQMVTRLLHKLIGGYWVGPATAIGEDYRVLETKRVVEVRSEPNGLFSMRLLKRDVGQMALLVIKEGDASDRSLVALPGASITEYLPPEVDRVNTRKKRQDLGAEHVEDLLQTLRTGRLGK